MGVIYVPMSTKDQLIKFKGYLCQGQSSQNSFFPDQKKIQDIYFRPKNGIKPR